MKIISIVSSCFNEAENVGELCSRVKAQMNYLGTGYEYEHILADNGSTDNTADTLRLLAAKDKHIKVIINSRNFGHIRSPFYCIIQATGDAVIYMASDLQDPPELIGEFVKKWNEGYKMVLGVKKSSKENPLLFLIRKLFYSLIQRMADDETTLVKNYNGFGLYDRKIVDIMKSLDDPYPYLRGLVSEIGFEKAIVEFSQPVRKHGLSKNRFYSLFDNAMIGITKHSKVPLRLATFFGLGLSFLSFLVAIGYGAAKLIFWNNFQLGLAPLIIGVFFFFSVQLFFLGILGEYIGAVLTRVNKKPLVIEKERINF